jgi:hypothetical protein
VLLLLILPPYPRGWYRPWRFFSCSFSRCV